jgi:UrcA family protein
VKQLKMAAAAYAGVTGLFLATGIGLAHAQPMVVEAERPHAAISYADLNLASPAGQAALKARVERAAARLCLSRGAPPPQERMQRKRCFASAMAGAEPQIARAISDQAIRFARRQTIEVALSK